MLLVRLLCFISCRWRGSVVDDGIGDGSDHVARLLPLFCVVVDNGSVVDIGVWLLLECCYWCLCYGLSLCLSLVLLSFGGGVAAGDVVVDGVVRCCGCIDIDDVECVIDIGFFGIGMLFIFGVIGVVTWLSMMLLYVVVLVLLLHFVVLLAVLTLVKYVVVGFVVVGFVDVVVVVGGGCGGWCGSVGGGCCAGGIVIYGVVARVGVVVVCAVVAVDDVNNASVRIGYMYAVVHVCVAVFLLIMMLLMILTCVQVTSMRLAMVCVLLTMVVLSRLLWWWCWR